jgi:hypothetical protein
MKNGGSLYEDSLLSYLPVATMPVRLWLILGLIFALAGCTPQSQDSVEPGGLTPEPASTQSTAGEELPTPTKPDCDSYTGCGEELGKPQMTKVADENQCSLEQWVVTLNTSGGFAGVRQRITMNERGEITFYNEKTGEEKRIQGEQRDIDEVQNALSALCGLATEASHERPTSQCADCFIYELTIESKSINLVVEADDISIQESSYLPLISLLKTLNDRIQK